MVEFSIGAVYRHYQGEAYVAHLRPDSQGTDDPIVVLRNCLRGRLVAMPLSHFAEVVELPSGEKVPRFSVDTPAPQ